VANGSHAPTAANLYAIGPGGLVKWSYNLYRGPVSNAALGPDETVYASSGAGLWAVSSSGVLKWRALTPGSEIAVSTTSVYVSAAGGVLRRYSFDGVLLNETTLFEEPYAYP